MWVGVDFADDFRAAVVLLKEDEVWVGSKVEVKSGFGFGVEMVVGV